MDDDGLVQRATARMLRTLGFETHIVASAQEALGELQSSDYSALVTDEDMPGLNGSDLICQLRSKGIELPTVVMSGRGAPEIDVVFLRKPFSRHQMATALATAGLVMPDRVS